MKGTAKSKTRATNAATYQFARQIVEMGYAWGEAFYIARNRGFNRRGDLVLSIYPPDYRRPDAN